MLTDTVHFLQNYAPFDLIPSTDLAQLAQKATLEYFEKDDLIFREGEEPKPYFFVIKKGSVRMEQSQNQLVILIDQGDEGDIFGFRAFLANDSYLMSVTASEGTLVYTFPSQFFRDLMEKYPKVALFFASGFAMGLNQHPENQGNNHRKYFAKPNATQVHLEFMAGHFLEVEQTQPIITCTPENSILEAAQIMKKYNIGSLPIINKKRHPVGILTDSDFRRKVVANPEPIKNLAVREVMSQPVKTVAPQTNLSELTILMISHRISHLCITTDGTPDSEILGVISQRDILLNQGNSPSVLAQEILKTTHLDKLKLIRDKAENLVENYLNQGISINYIANIITNINDLVIQKAIEITQEKLQHQGIEKPNLAFCWLTLGSEGRKEQLLRTDQDTALIYENPESENLEKVQNYFLRLAEGITDILIHCGFVRCPADMMASNPKWCQSVAAWENYFLGWIANPSNQNVLNANIFLDFRPVFGEFKLANDLKTYIFETINTYPKFLNYLAKSALENPPPLSFFRNFVVEKTGDHKDQFDIKARAMMPLVDASRVLVYDLKINSFDSTSERFRKIAQHDKHLAELAESCAVAYEILVQHRTKNGLQNQDSGRYLDPRDFNKIERQNLRQVFSLIRKLQQILEVRYQLAYLMR